MIDGLIVSNAPPEVIEDAIAQSERSKNEQCEVWEENVLSFTHFLQLQTQWNIVDGSGYFTGLNYESVIAYLKLMLPAKQVADVFRDLQVMEFAALPFLNKKKED